LKVEIRICECSSMIVHVIQNLDECESFMMKSMVND